VRFVIEAPECAGRDSIGPLRDARERVAVGEIDEVVVPSRCFDRHGPCAQTGGTQP